MEIAEKYKMYRQAGIALNGKITEEALNSDMIYDAIKLLEITRERDTIFFDSEFEADVLHDFMLLEAVKGRKRAVEIYKEQYSFDGELEEEILEALINSYTSLFRIDSVNKTEHILHLSDILSGESGIRLVDMGFSMNAKEGMLIFTRLISFDDFCMTSGVSFLFKPGLEGYLKKRHRKIMKEMKDENDSLKRFVAFLKLSRNCGLEVVNKWAQYQNRLI